jgi:hypothetical protein
VQQQKNNNTQLKMGEQQFFLKWNDFQNNMVSSFKHLRDEKSFTDVSFSLLLQFIEFQRSVKKATTISWTFKFRFFSKGYLGL